MASTLRPKDAATLVLIKNPGIAPEVLLGQRHGGHAFMPNRYVFPGGRVDPLDSRVVPATNLTRDVAHQLEKNCSPARARALAVAAVRETYEETGLMLAGEMPDGVLTSRHGSWSAFAKQGVGPALANLDYICRAITPPGRSRRFHARFFMVDAIHARGQIKGSGELLDIGWVPLEEAAKLPIPSVTGLVLKEVISLISNPPPRNKSRATPVYQRRYGQDSIRRE
tara:strand:- start:307 stop:981 length:675 start_codon:yes stop_codon:yes gene_type:complete